MANIEMKESTYNEYSWNIPELDIELRIVTSSKIAKWLDAKINAPNDKELCSRALACLEKSTTDVPYTGFGFEYRQAKKEHAEVIAELRKRLK